MARNFSAVMQNGAVGAEEMEAVSDTGQAQQRRTATRTSRLVAPRRDAKHTCCCQTVWEEQTNRHETSPEIKILQAILVHSGCWQKSSRFMAWDEHQLPATDGAMAAKRKGPVVFGKKSMTRTKGCQTSPCRHENEEQAAATSRTYAGTLQHWRTIQAFHQRELQRLQHQDELHHPGRGQCGTQLQRGSCGRIRAQ